MNKSFLKVAIAIIALLGCGSTQAAPDFEPVIPKIDPTVFVMAGVRGRLKYAKTLKDFHAVRQTLLKALPNGEHEDFAQFWLAETTRRVVRHASTLASPEAEMAGIDLALFDADEAIRRYSLTIDKYPKDARAYFGRGSFYLERNTAADNAKAISDFDAALMLDPKFAQAYLARALAQGRAQNPSLEKIFADYDKALTLGIPAKGEDATYEKIIAPRLKATAHTGRGTIYLHQNQPQKALLDFNAALAAYPDAHDARLARAKVLVRQKQFENALADLNFVLEKAPENAAALAARAEIYRSQNQNEKARSEMRRALLLDGSQSTQATAPAYTGLAASLEAQQRGDKFMTTGNLDEAQAEYSKALELDKENAEALAGRATVKMRRKDLTGAQADLDEALKLQPDNVKNLTARGQVLARQGKFDLALADLEKATKLAPGNVAAWEQTGIVQQAQGKYSEAEKSYDKAIGFVALNLDGQSNASFWLAPVRRLIVRAAQGIDQDWETDLQKIPTEMYSVGVLLAEVELRKHPDSAALKSLNAALNKVGNIF